MILESTFDQHDSDQNDFFEAVAIIAVAGRFPQADSVETFWQNICAGVEAISPITPEDDTVLQHDPSLGANPNYVPAGSFIDGIDYFDAAFFGYNAREATLIDPQQRLFLECAWEALERSGYDSAQYPGKIGIYAGVGMNTYMINHLAPNRGLLASMGLFQAMLSNEKDYLATRIAYKLGLRGPSISVQTACSTSLVAVALAYQSLMTYQCDMALAGGVSILSLEKGGYVYERGGIGSPDGHCRAFDADSKGTVGGNGLGIVVLKRLSEALADGDTICAVIRGAAINNDGDAKMGYTTPSIEGQAEVISEALAVAAVDAGDISYIETHGTGTFVGDPIEVAALTQAFRTQTDKVGYCALGAVKPNIGHLDIAAGVTGLIKAALALKHGVIPPTINFTEPNPQIDFATSPFFVNTTLRPWERGASSRLAGVSSFGIGGTNAHVVLEEAPEQTQLRDSDAPTVLMLSAKSAAALESATDRLAQHLRAHPEQRLVDVAYTLQVGRRTFPFRRSVVCDNREAGITALETRTPNKLFSAVYKPGDRSLIFLFPGQGSQHINMGRQLYLSEPRYREIVDYCSERMIQWLGLDLRTILFPTPESEAAATEQLNQTWFSQAALFVTEYGVAKLLEACGVSPTAMIGHSLGEYVAACLAGVISLDDALYVVSERGRLMQSMQAGSMVSVSASAEEIHPFLRDDLSIAVVYGPSLCVVGGSDAAVDSLISSLSEQNIDHRRLHTSHAFHTSMMDPMLEPFRQIMAAIQLNPPHIPYISCTTGTWITGEQTSDPTYWAAHVRQTVKLADGLTTLLAEPGCVLVEVGPVQTLRALLKQIAPEATQTITSIPVMRHPMDSQPDMQVFLTALAKLRLTGVPIRLEGLDTHQDCRRVLLPTYPFERRRYWIEAYRETSTASENTAHIILGEIPDDAETAAAEQERGYLLTEFVAPRTETEAKVIAVFQEYLGSNGIGVHDNFFELGGDSLLAIGMMAKLRDVFQVELAEQMLYEQPTAAALSMIIDQAATLTQIVAVPRDQPLLASWHQERRWVRDQLHPDETLNNNLSIGWMLYGSLDHQAFEQAVNEITQHHEILRTSFEERDGRLYQVIHPSAYIEVPLIDLRHLPETERMAEFQRSAGEIESTGFDMRQLPLWRTVIYQLDTKQFAWILVGHQAVWDGISIHIFQNDLSMFLNKIVNQPEIEIPPLTVQVADVSEWERRRFAGDVLDQELAYWGQKLAGHLEPINFATDRPRSKQQGLSKRFEYDLPAHLTTQLKALAQEQGATLYMMLLAGFKTLCYGYTGQTTILIEGSFPSRDRSEMKPLIGPFVNMVTLRTDLTGTQSSRTVLTNTRETVMESLAHRELPFAKVLEAHLPEYYRQHSRLARVFFAQYPVGDSASALPNLTYGDRLWFRRASVELYMSVIDTGQEVTLAWEYNTYLYDEQTMLRMSNDYLELLQQIVATPDAPIDQLVSKYAQQVSHINA